MAAQRSSPTKTGRGFLLRRVLRGRLCDRLIYPHSLLMPTEVAVVAGVSRRQVFYLMDSGTLKTRRYDGRRYVRAGEAVRYARARRRRG